MPTTVPGIPETWDEAELRAAVESLLGTGRLHYYRTTDSTNDRARELAERGAAEWSLVISEEQTRGRGRMGRGWHSPAGTGIWLSLVLRPPLRPAESARLTLLAAVAVSGAIEAATSLPAGIKWPNDITLQGRKVAGILTEMGADSSRVSHIVVGIGINVNTLDFPEEIRSTATSLRLCRGREVDRIKILLPLLREFRKWYYKLIGGGGVEELREIYRRRSVVLGRRVKITGPGRDFFARALEIADDGSLLVRTDAGEEVKVISGEVSLREAD